MSIVLGLRLAYVVLAISLTALAVTIGSSLLHMPLPPSLAKSIAFASYVWPLALYAVAVYRKRLKQDAERT